MKKRFLTLLLVLCALPFTMLISACDSGKKQTELESNMITLEYSFVDYDGTYKEPAVTVRVNNDIIDDDEYDIDYINNLNVGMADVLVSAKTGSDVIKGEAVASFEILRVEKNVSTLNELKNALTNSNYTTINVTEDITVPAGESLEIPYGKVVNLDENSLTILGEYENSGIVNANVDSGERLVEIYQYANKAQLVNDISAVAEGDYAGKIRLIAYKTKAFYLEMNGFDINAEVDFVNYETTANRPTDVHMTVILNNSAQEKVIIGDNAKPYGLCVMGYGQHNIILNNIKFIANAYAMSTNGYYEGSTVTVTNCEFEGTSLGAYLPAKYSYTFENCKFTGESGYYAKSGIHTLTNNEFKGTGSFLAPKHCGNGANPTGSALIIDSAAGYMSPLIVNIVGGKFTSLNGYGVETYITGSTAPYSTVEFAGTEIYDVDKANIYSSYDNWDGSVAEVPAEVEENVIEIETAEQLAGLAKAVNEGNTFENKTIKLVTNIDLQNKEWTPIGYGTFDNNNYVVKNGYAFKGTFDGQNFVVYNLKITEFNKGGEATGTSSGVALFGNVVGGTIKNVVVNTACIVGNHYVSTIVGFGSGVTIDNCDVYNATIDCVYADEDESGDKAGLVLGYSSNISGKTITITNCHAENSKVFADRDAGQLIGKLASGAVVNGNSAIDVTVEWNESSKDVDGYSRGDTGIKNEIIGG